MNLQSTVNRLMRRLKTTFFKENYKAVAYHFNSHWESYKLSIDNNRFFHKEFFAALDQFIEETMGERPITLVDAGCGDCSPIKPVLESRNIKEYVGIDIAADVLHLAATNLAGLNFSKQWMVSTMDTAIYRIKNGVDIILTSHALHHLSREDKVNFIRECQNKLNTPGYLLIIDGSLHEDQTREQWLEAYEAYHKAAYPWVSDEDREWVLEHPRTSDFPEKISTYANIAAAMNWKKFDIRLQIGSQIFLIFSK